MADIARLQIEVDSRATQRGREELSRLTSESERSERATRNMGSTQQASSRQQAASINELSERIRHLEQLRNRAHRTDQVQSYNREIDHLIRKKRDLENQGRQVGEVTERNNQLFQMGAGLLASYFSIHTIRNITRLATETAAFADEIDKMNIRTGLGVQFLQEMRFVGDQVGVSFGSLESVVESFNRRIPQIIDGGGRAGEVMTQLGVSLFDSEGQMRSMNDILPDIITAFRGMENETERNALATQLLGRRSAELIPLFNAEQEEIERLTRRYRDMGVALDEEGIRKGVEFHDRLAELETRTEGLRREMGFFVMDIMTDYVEVMEAAIDVTNRLTGEQGMGGFLSIVRQAENAINPLSVVTDLLFSGARAYNTFTDSIDKGKQVAGEALLMWGQEREALIERNRQTEEAAETNERLARTVGGIRQEISGLQEAIQEASTAEEVARLQYEIGGLEVELQKLFGTLAQKPTIGAREAVNEIIDITDELGRQIAGFEGIDFSMAGLGSIAHLEDQLSGLNQRLRETTSESERAFLRERIAETSDEIDKMKGNTEELSDTARDLGFTFESAFENALMNVTDLNSLLGVTQGLLRDIQRIFLREKVTGPLSDALIGAFSSGSGGGAEAVDDLIISNSGRVFKPNPKDTIMAVQDLAGLTGGQKASVNVNVNVRNESGSQVDVQERQMPNGDVRMDILIKDAMENLMGSGRLDRAFNQNFGVSRRGRNRA